MKQLGLIVLAVLPQVVFGQTDTSGLSFEINNPLRESISTDITGAGLVNAILNFLLVLAVPIIVFFIILAGFKYVMAQGNTTKLQEASQALLYALIGSVLIIGAMAITQIIIRMLGGLSS